MAKRETRTAEYRTPLDDLVRRFPFALGGPSSFREMPAAERLDYLRGETRAQPKGLRRFTGLIPQIPATGKPFSIRVGLPLRRQASLISLEVRFPSGTTERLSYRPTAAERKKRRADLGPFESARAGDIYALARIYFTDGSTATDAILRTVLSRNPDQLTITPRVSLVSGRAGRVEYDWDTDEFHCRANGTITNGSSSTRTYRRCSVRVTDGGESGTLISSFSFGVGPFSVPPGGTAHRTIDTWYARGSDVWDKFNRRWDLTVKFTYESDGGSDVADSAAYRPMSTVPINAIKTADFTAGQTAAERDAVALAAEILEDRDVTLFDPSWRILSREDDKAKYGIIDIGWRDDWWDFDEAQDMYEDISGPEQDRLDVFIPMAFAYTDDVPEDKRNVGGFSTEDGPFPKDDERRRSGCLVLLDENDPEFFGVAVAHEICHYLGLQHVADEQTDNLMHKNGGTTDHKLTWDQWNTIRQHGMMKWLAPDI